MSEDDLDDLPNEAPAAAVTVLDRLVGAGIEAQRARAWLGSGLVRVDGVNVADPQTPAAPPARIVLMPG